MRENLILLPPITFIIVLLVSWGLSLLASYWSFKKKERVTPPYSCGEQFSDHLIQPDYSQFFPFAFFFTILHVVAMVVATIPVETPESFAMVLVYLALAFTGMVLLLRR